MNSLVYSGIGIALVVVAVCWHLGRSTRRPPEPQSPSSPPVPEPPPSPEIKLHLEVDLLRKQVRWEPWKNWATIVVPIFTLATIVGGLYAYFKEENRKQQLRREEVFVSGMQNLAHSDELIRVAAITSMLSYVDQDPEYSSRVLTLLIHRATVETSVVVTETLMGNLRKLNREPRFRSELEILEASTRDLLVRVRDDLKRETWKLQPNPDKAKKDLMEQVQRLEPYLRIVETIRAQGYGNLKPR